MDDLSKSEILKNTFVGSPDAFKEERDSKEKEDFYYNVFVPFMNIDSFLDERSLCVGPKGSGKSRIYKFLLDQYSTKYINHNRTNKPDYIKNNIWRHGTRNKIIAVFINLHHENPDLIHQQHNFQTILNDINNKLQQQNKKYQDNEDIEAIFNFVDHNNLKNTWGYILVYFVLKELLVFFTSEISIKPKNKYQKKHRKEILNSYKSFNDLFDLYELKESSKPLDWLFNKTIKKLMSKYRKLGGKIAVAGTEVSPHIVNQKINEINHKGKLLEIDNLLTKMEKEVYIFFDNTDLLLPKHSENVTVCFLYPLFETLTSQYEFYKNISFKVFSRTDIPMRVNFAGVDRLTSSYTLLLINRKNLLVFILKRLLYNKNILSYVKKTHKIEFNEIDSMTEEQLDSIFNTIFSDVILPFNYHMPAFLMKNYKLSDNTVTNGFHLSDYLYYFLMDGKGSICLRHVISFMRYCIEIENSNQGKNKADIEDDKLITKNTITKSLERVNNDIFNQLNKEYQFFYHKLNDLKVFSTEKEISRTAMEKFVAEEITNESLLTIKSLFYTGIIGGDAKIWDDCTTFYLPVFVQAALGGDSGDK